MFLLLEMCSGLTSGGVRPLRSGRAASLSRATAPACSSLQSPEDSIEAAPAAPQLEQRWLRPVPVAATVLGALLVCSPSAAHAAALGAGLGDGSFLQAAQHGQSGCLGWATAGHHGLLSPLMNRKA